MPNFLKTRIPLLSPRCHLCTISAIAGCYIKYKILRYFNISCSLSRNDRLSEMGSKILLLKNDIFHFVLYFGKYFTVLVLL